MKRSERVSRQNPDRFGSIAQPPSKAGRLTGGNKQGPQGTRPLADGEPDYQIRPTPRRPSR